MTLVILGFLVGAVALIAARPAGLLAGAGLVLVGGVAGKLLQLMGLGQRKGA